MFLQIGANFGKARVPFLKGATCHAECRGQWRDLPQPRFLNDVLGKLETTPQYDARTTVATKNCF
jgi:hypothetical protein